MINKKPITLNDDLFNAMVEVVSDNTCEYRHIEDYEKHLFSNLTFKNAVYYIAEQSAKKYNGDWRVAHISNSDLSFLHLETSEPVQLYRYSKDGSLGSDTINIDGRIFGLLISMHAYRFLYFANLQRGNRAQGLAYNNYGYRLKKAINQHSGIVVKQDWQASIGHEDSSALDNALDIINRYTEKDYAL